MGRLVMAYWDCPICGNKGIKGDQMSCPSCGRARGDVQFYMMNGPAEGGSLEADERKDLEYLSEEKAAEIGKNPDWYCSFCNSLNRDNAAFCTTCGASRESSESNYFDQLKKKKEAEQAEAAAQARNQPQPKKSGSKKPLLILIAVAVAIVALFMYFNGNKTQGDLEIAALAWQRSIPVEQNIKYSESGYSVPQGAVQTGEETETYFVQVLDHYEDVEVQRSRQVVDHYETYYTYSDNGNGTFEEIEHERPVYTTEYYTETVQEPVYRSEPRYRTRYSYDIWRWTYTRSADSSGTDHNTFWAELNLAEDERESSPRYEQYGFVVRDEKEKLTSWSLSEEEWMKLNVGDRLNITTKRTGADAWITDEKGNQITQLSPWKTK
ncbi:MAG: zinc ribbon domain-containing protein [Clostridium sp.]|nr:zinc ribbon domain-containing protein [Clostridium sp.]